MGRVSRTLALVLAASVWAATAAGAQMRFERLEVVVWPEYDRPAVLVMLRGTLSSEVSLPTIVSLSMPAVAGAPHAVAKQQPDGGLAVAQYTVSTDGDWSRVDLLTDVPIFRLEYYVPLDTSDSQRRFRFYWPGGVDIGAVAYEVLHPVDATSLTVKPPADGIGEADGLTFYNAELGARSAAESFSIALAYSKSTARLSSPAAQAAPPVEVIDPPAPAVSDGPAARTDWLLLVILGLAAAVFGAFMFRRPRSPEGN
jgi:hypothetical protein